jgi:hypothetical protein
VRRAIFFDGSQSYLTMCLNAEMWLIPVSIQPRVASKTSSESEGSSMDRDRITVPFIAVFYPRSSQPERTAMMLTDESAMATAMTGDNNTRNTG